MKHIDVFIDFKSPASYLAVGPTRDFATQTGLDIRWHPFNSRQRPVPRFRENETRRESHFRVREQARREMHLHYAGVQGLPMSFPDQPGETRLALAGLNAAADCTDDFIDQAFRAYWVDHEDLNDPALVSALLQSAGGVSGTPDLAWLDEQQAWAESLGVFDVPMYLVRDQRFLGREHLPLLTEVVSSG